jgi:hypothetical protein
MSIPGKGWTVTFQNGISAGFMKGTSKTVLDFGQEYSNQKLKRIIKTTLRKSEPE